MDGKELQGRRRVLGLSQSELAQRIGTLPRTLASWESGQRPIPYPAMMSGYLRWLEMRARDNARKRRWDRSQKARKPGPGRGQLTYY